LLLSAPRPASAATITVDASKQTSGNPHFWSSTVGTGTAKLTLRGDLQTHYKIGNREAGFQRVRGHGLMDNTGMYKSAGSYDFAPLDTYLTAISTANMRPIMELDFFPSAMGTSRAPLSSYTDWNAYVKAVAQHCVDKFGADDVGTWYWEVWNEPDYDGFWSGTDMTKYYTLYDNTVDALVSVLPNVLVGGPATTQSSPISAFLAHCKSAGKRVTFASSHNYPGGAATGTSADAATLVTDNNSRVSAITGNGYTTANVKSFNTEWNSSYSGQGNQVGDATASMDNHWNVGFILKAAKLLSDKNSGDTPAIDVFSYWALTDVFDESSGTDGSYMIGKSYPFGYVFGLITVQGMRKAAFNAFKLLNYTSTKRLSSSGGTGSDGIDAMATTTDAGDSLQILVYNYYKTLNTASGSGDSVTINVSNLPSALANKQVFVTQFLVDETHSNPYNVWQGQSKPGSPTEAQWQAMRAAQHLALYPNTKVGDQQTVTTSFSTTFNLSKQAGTLIIVSTKRPLSGRNALVEIEGEDYDGQSGATKEDSSDSTTLGQSISLSSGGWVYFENVDYTDDGVGSVQLRVKSGSDTTLELHQDSATGTLLGSCKVSSTSNAWATQTCTLSQTVTGVSKLYVVPSGAIHLNYLKFQPGNTPAGTGGAVGGGGATGSGGTSGSGGAGGGAGTSGSGAGGSGAGGSTAKPSTGGSGGNSSGGSGGNASGGTSGKGGSSGSGGTASGGSGGSNNGGSGGSNSGGSAGNASGGSGGSASGGSGGSASGGSGGSASGGSGGSASGGSGGSASGGSGGNSGSGGSTTGGGTASGCSCRIGNSARPSGTLLIVGLVAAVFGLRRQRARRRR
jgi:xylan 1,4-beta-xylosidase